MAGGLDLAQLLAMLGQGGGVGDAGIGTGLGLGAGVGAGSFGQGGQDLSSLTGSLPGLGGTPGQSTIAGGTQGGALGMGAGSIDPLSIVQKALGLGSKLAGLGSQIQTASPTLGDTGGVSLSDQVRSGQGGALAAPTSSPTYGVINPVTGLPETGTQTQPVIGPDGVPITGFGETGGKGAAPGTAIGAPVPGADLNLTNTLGQGAGQAQQALYDALKGAGLSDTEILPLLQQAGGGFGFSAGEIPGGGASIPSGGLSGAGATTASPTGGLGGALGTGGAGLGALSSILGLIQALKSGSPTGTAGGLVNTAAGTAGFADKLGLLSQGGSEALNTVGGYLPLIGALLTGIGAGGNVAQANESGQVTEAALAGAIPALMGSGVGAFAAPVLGVAMAITDALSKPGNRDINRFTGIQGPQTTSALENIANLTQGQDLSQLSNQALESLIPMEGRALERYYNENLPEARYLTGLQAEQSPEFGQVKQALTADQNALLQSVGLLQQRGVGNDVLGNLMSPQLNNISQMYNSDFVGAPGYTSPAALMQQQGISSNEALANVYGGPTWMALNQIFGPNLGSMLGGFGGTAPGLNIPQAPAGNLAADIAATQYNPTAAPTAEQIASQYGAAPAWLGSPE